MADKNKKKIKMNKVLVYSITLLLIVTGLLWLNKKGEEFKNQKSVSSQKSSQTPVIKAKENITNQESPKDSATGKNEETKNTSEAITRVNDFGSVGSLNHQYLQASPFSKLILEIDYANSTPPDQNAVDTFVSTIKQYVNKPGDIIQAGNNSFTSQKETYTSSDLLDLAQKHRTNYSAGDTVTLYILFINGSFAQNGNALGVALNSSMFVIFKDKINQATTALVFASEIEQAVLNHELGHLLGLVNINYKSGLDHEDANNLYHSNNKESVMFWAVEDISVANLLRGGPPYQFDSADKYDLEKVKEGKY